MSLGWHVEMKAAELLVLQHIACEPPAAYEDELRERNISFVRVEVDEGEEIPNGQAFAGVIAMGGPMGAYDDAKHPWLAAEKKMIGAAVRNGLPFWGICLGAQLLAASLGARVYPGEQPEVGIEPVWRTRASNNDPVFSGAPKEFMTLQWHSDTFDLPSGAILLASSRAYQHQAFVWHRAYGLQFHLEVDATLAAQWGCVTEYAESLESLQGPGAVDGLVHDVEEHSQATVPLARQLFSAWLDQVVELPSAP